MLTRRIFLLSGAALTGYTALKPVFSWAKTPGGHHRLFLELSTLLTGKSLLSPDAAERALAGLTEVYAAFPQKLEQLSSALQAAGINHADTLNGHAMMDSVHGETIKTIVSAWYLGYTGTPIPLRAVDNTRFVTYTDALAYAPTLDATVIPSWSRGQTNYWVHPPATLSTD